MDYDSIKEIVYSFKSKHESGFVKSEILEILKKFPEINMMKFNDALDYITVMYIDNEIVIYQHDVVKAIYSGMQKNLWNNK
jgi:hypothetical protein